RRAWVCVCNLSGGGYAEPAAHAFSCLPRAGFDHRQKECLAMLNRVVRTGFVAAVASGVFWASPGLAMRDVALQDASSGTEAPSPTQSTVLSRFQVSLHRGDPGYDWVSALAGNLVMAESIAFSVSYPARESWVQSLRPEEAILINGAFENPAGASKGISDGFSNPREPDGTG